MAASFASSKALRRINATPDLASTVGSVWELKCLNFTSHLRRRMPVECLSNARRMPVE